MNKPKKAFEDLKMIMIQLPRFNKDFEACCDSFEILTIFAFKS